MGEGAHMTPIIAAKIRPLIDIIIEEARSWELAGHSADEASSHAFASLAVAIRMMVRGVYDEVPLLKDGDEELLVLSLNSGAAQARQGKTFDSCL
jgi:hypothetical protein